MEESYNIVIYEQTEQDNIVGPPRNISSHYSVLQSTGMIQHKTRVAYHALLLPSTFLLR